MLPAAHRLRRSVDFERAVRRGVRAGGPTMVVHLSADAEGAAAPMVGFVVSKAVGDAVRRNLVKRRLRAAMSGRISSLPDHMRIVVRALPSAAHATYAQLDRDLGNGVERALHKASTVNRTPRVAASVHHEGTP